MNGDTLQRIRQASPTIRNRWEELLRGAPPTTPVSNPEAMAPRIAESLAQVIRALSWYSIHRAPVRRRPLPGRGCMHNPFRAYFSAGEQAILELIAPPAAAAAAGLSDRPDSAGATASPALAESSAGPDAAGSSDEAAVTRAIETLSAADVAAFCALCRKYRLVSDCRCERERVGSP